MFQEKQLDSLKADAEREMLKLLQYSHEIFLKQKQKTELRKDRISESIANYVAENYYQKKHKKHDSNINNKREKHRECKR